MRLSREMMANKKLTSILILPLLWLIQIDARQFTYSSGYMRIEDSQLIIKTTKGLIRGQRVRSATDKFVDEFLGIPYAKPPTGSYRFKHPRPLSPSDEIFNATTPANTCFQKNDTTFGNKFAGTLMWNANTNLDEDCLKLNIWIPTPRPTNASVLVWIYGGSYNTGTISLNLYDGKLFASEENIILVSINYRVGNFGFLYLEEARSEAPGNAGLFDQLMALQWIQENIKFFGGNPDQVTLFGESAGAACIGFHLLSPLSRNLFKQAILQSGSPTTPWAITDSHTISKRSKRLARDVGCMQEDINELMDCLYKVDPNELSEKEFETDSDYDGRKYGVVEFGFTPIVDGSFIINEPEIMLKNKDFKKTNLLMGSNKEEGSYFIIYKLTNSTDEVYVNRIDFQNWIRNFGPPDLYPIVQDGLIYQYTDWINPEDTVINTDRLDKMVGDYYFTCNVNHLANRYVETGNQVFMYYFTHRSSQNPWPKWMGTMHGDEIAFVFGEPIINKHLYTPEEVMLSRQMMKAWANFAKRGNPSSYENDGWSNQLIWPLYSYAQKEYLTFDTHYQIGHGIRLNYCSFLLNYIPELNDKVESLEKTCISNSFLSKITGTIQMINAAIILMVIFFL